MYVTRDVCQPAQSPWSDLSASSHAGNGQLGGQFFRQDLRDLRETGVARPATHLPGYLVVICEISDRTGAHAKCESSKCHAMLGTITAYWLHDPEFWC